MLVLLISLLPDRASFIKISPAPLAPPVGLENDQAISHPPQIHELWLHEPGVPDAGVLDCWRLDGTPACAHSSHSSGHHSVCGLRARRSRQRQLQLVRKGSCSAIVGGHTTSLGLEVRVLKCRKKRLELCFVMLSLHHNGLLLHGWAKCPGFLCSSARCRGSKLQSCAFLRTSRS